MSGGTHAPAEGPWFHPCHPQESERLSPPCSPATESCWRTQQLDAPKSFQRLRVVTENRAATVGLAPPWELLALVTMIITGKQGQLQLSQCDSGCQTPWEGPHVLQHPPSRGSSPPLSPASRSTLAASLGGDGPFPPWVCLEKQLSPSVRTTQIHLVTP